MGSRVKQILDTRMDIQFLRATDLRLFMDIIFKVNSQTKTRDIFKAPKPRSTRAMKSI